MEVRLAVAIGSLVFAFPASGKDVRSMGDVPELRADGGTVAGDCVGEGGTYALAELLLLENRHVRWGRQGSQVEFDVSREEVSIHRTEPDGGTSRAGIQVDHFLSPDADIDILLKPALYRGDLFIYWRETYQHRRYRQGLVRVSRSGLTRICEGEGGEERVSASH